MKFPADYPYSPPTVKFLSKMWHPNVYEVCYSAVSGGHHLYVTSECTLYCSVYVCVSSHPLGRRSTRLPLWVSVRGWMLEWCCLHINPAPSSWRSSEWRASVWTMESNTECPVGPSCYFLKIHSFLTFVFLVFFKFWVHFKLSPSFLCHIEQSHFSK